MTASPKNQSATHASVGFSLTAVSIFPVGAQSARRVVFNDADGPLYLAINGAASTTNFMVKIAAGGYYEFPLPLFGGAVSGIWTAATTGAARTTVY